MGTRDEEFEQLRARLVNAAAESVSLWKDAVEAAGQICGQQRARADKAEAERDALKEENGKLRRQLLDQQNHARTLMNEADDVRAQLEAESDLYYLLRSERDTLKASVESSNVARFAADVLSLVADYSDPERDIVARLPFLATFDQWCFEKYGLVLDETPAPTAPDTDAEQLPLFHLTEKDDN